MCNGFQQWAGVEQASTCRVETRLDLHSAGLNNAGKSACAAIRLRG
jgi:hypothetical protein